MISSSTRKWLIFASTSVLLILTNVDMTAVNLALAPMAADLHLNIINVQWVISAYLIGGASMVMLGGLLGDMFGNKKVFLGGAALFTIASLGVGLAFSEWSIIITRLIQGFGAALAWPLAIVIIHQAFASEEAFGIGLITAVMGSSMSIGPPLGGVILHYLNWRWIFFINIPLGSLALLVGYLYLLGDHKKFSLRELHLPSIVLLIIGLLSFTFAINEVQQLGIRSPIILTTLIGGIVLLAIFIYLQKVITNPLLDLNLFKNRALASCFIVRFLWQVIWIGIFLILSLLFQNILGYSSLETGIYFLIATFSFAIISTFSGKLQKHFSPRILIITAFVFYIPFFIWFALITQQTPSWELGIIYLLYGIGSGIGFPVLLNTTLELAPANKRGMASGILYACLFAGGSVGAILVGALINTIAPKFLQHQLQHLGISLTHSIHKTLIAVATGVRSIHTLANYPQEHLAKLFVTITSQSFFNAFRITMIVFVIISIVTACTAWFIKKRINP